MNFQFYVEKLKASEKYKEFIKENPDAYPCSGFIIIEPGGKDNQQHVDFFLKDKIFSFKIEAGCELVPVEIIGNEIPEQISLDVNFNFEEIQKLIQDKMQEQKINNKIQKFLFSFQKKDKKHFLNGTVFISNLGMLKACIDLESMVVTELEKKSFFDVMKPFKKKD